MNRTEFNEFCTSHAKRFGEGCKKVLQDAGVLKDWYEVLRGADAADVEEASRRMFADEDLQPHGWHKHPARLKSLAWSISLERKADTKRAKSFADGQQVYDCPHCCDTGMITDVVAPRFVQQYRAGQVEVERGERIKSGKEYPYVLMTPRCIRYTLACPCRHGDAFNVERVWGQGRGINSQRRRLTVFDASQHLRTSAHNERLLMDLDDWITDHKPENHDTSFDTWNQSA